MRSSENIQIESNRSWISIVLSMAADLLFHWKIIVSVTVISGIAGTIFAYSLKTTYRASAVIIFPTQQNDLGNLLGSVVGVQAASLLQGSSSGTAVSTKNVEALLGSRALVIAAADKFHLVQRWELSTSRIEDIQAGWKKCFQYEITDLNSLEMSYVDRSPDTSKMILQFVSSWLDSAYTSSSMAISKRSQAFIDEQLADRKKMMESSEDSLASLQLREMFLFPHEQLQRSILQNAELEADAEKLRFEMKLLGKTEGSQSSNVQVLKATLDEVESSRKRNINKSESGSLIKGASVGTQLMLDYERRLRTVKIHQVVFTFLQQQAEQLRLENAKRVSVLIPVDPPITPEKKASPPRTAIVASFMLVGFVISVSYSFLQKSISQGESPEQMEWRRFLDALSRLAFWRQPKRIA